MFRFGSNLQKKGAKSLPRALFIQRENANGSDVAPIFLGDLNHSEKL